MKSQPQASSLPRGPRNRRGFALLITITLLAFLVLLLVSLASLTRVETQVASNSAQLAQARQNALFALNIAVGELQKYAGPDQRATATAEIIAAAPNSGGGTSKWVGVWGNSSNPHAALSSTSATLQWLVSRNESTGFDPANHVSSTDTTFGQITNVPAAADFLPSDAVAGLSSSTVASSTLTVKGDPAVLLVGPNTVDFNSDVSARANGVVAPLVDIQVAGSTVPGAGASGPVTVGKYAWWVGDEGVKVRANVVDPYVTPKPGHAPAAVASLNRLAVAQRHQLEAITGLTVIPPNDGDLRSLLTLSQLPYLPSAPTTSAARARFHDVSLHSQGVLSDSLRGGLRRDLTWATAPNRDLATFRTALGLGGGGLETVASTNPLIDVGVMPKDHRGPTWEQLRSFAQVDATGALTARGHSAVQHGIHPYLVHAKIFFGGTTVLTGDPDKVRFRLLMFPGFVLANPTNVTIAANTYQILLATEGMTDESLVIKAYAPYQDWEGVSLRTLLGDGGATYILDCPDLAPGQAAAFTLRDVNGTGEQPLISGGLRRYYLENEWLRVPSNATVYHTGIAYNTSLIVEKKDVESDGVGITLDIPNPSSGAIDFRFRVFGGAHIQRVSQLRPARADGGGPAGAPFTIKTNIPTTPGSYNMDAFNVRRLQAGWSFKAVDMAAGQKQALGYHTQAGNVPNHQAYNEIRYPLWSQMNPFAIGPRREAALQGGAATASLGPETWGVMSKSTRDGFSDYYVVAPAAQQTLKNPHWAAGVADKTSNINNFSLSRANWRPFAFPKPLAPGAGGLASMIDLRHMNAGGYMEGDTGHPRVLSHYRPTQPIGAGRAQPYIPREDVFRDTTNGRFYDVSYLLNRKLLDGYFFSTYPQAGSVTAQERLANARLVPADSAVDLSNTAAFRGGNTYAPRDERLAASRLVIDGAFNINSTSVEAWRAFLGSLSGAHVNGATNLALPVVRSLYQAAGVANPPDYTGTPALAGNDAAWNGFRDLTDDQLDLLAEKIVEQIRLRGPALSLADFVNRRLIRSNDDVNGIGIAGAVQAAIDTSGINSSFPVQIHTEGGQRLTTPNPHPTPGVYADVAHLSPSQFEGSAAWVSQADILAPLLPVMSARSDTFRIRTYGEVRNPVTNERSGYAWCEAIVQRQPDYMAPGTEPTLAPDAAATASGLNRDFGRRFKVVSFRWLSSSDI